VCLEVGTAEGRGKLAQGWEGLWSWERGLIPGGLQMLFPGTGLRFWELQELGGQGNRGRLARTSQNE